MSWTTLVDAPTLIAYLGTHLGARELVLVDCRFQLNDPAWGAADYERAHIPGAVYAHLDRDLSGDKTGSNGRHPLPTPAALAATLGRLGISRSSQVVAYDQDNGMYASRLWWLLRWLGHDQVAVLDGGFAAWLAGGGGVESGYVQPSPQSFVAAEQAGMVASLADVVSVVAEGGPPRLLDARAAERFRGDIEPIDARAGHIPGAINHCFKDNLAADGRFLQPLVLRTRLQAALADRAPADVIAYCGSGVTACHNLLALEHAGLPGGRLYPGSWSEWSADETRPIATGS